MDNRLQKCGTGVQVNGNVSVWFCSRSCNDKDKAGTNL